MSAYDNLGVEYDLSVVAVEPAAVMLARRPAGAAPAIRAVAETLPFASETFAAGMAVLTIHHWSGFAGGLHELRRVVRGPIAVLSWDAEVFNRYWMLTEYVPASSGLDGSMPTPQEVADLLGGGHVEKVEVPADCVDGFYAAWWRRPEAYLDPAVRRSISGLARLPRELVELGIKQLADDLASGLWHRRHADLLALDYYDAGYRLIVANDGARTGRVRSGQG